MKLLTKVFTIALLGLFSSLSYSGDTSIKYSHGTDTDRIDNGRITSEHLTINHLLNNSFGIGYRHSWYSVSDSDFTADAVSLVSRYQRNRLSVFGSLGLGKMDHSSETYIVGDIYADYRYSKYIDINLSVYGDTVESLKGLEGVYHYHGYSLGLDFHRGDLGLATSIHNQHLSNDNLRKVLNLKPYYSFADGWAVYTSHKHYTSSTGYNGIYFNPEEYVRHNVGLSFRQMVTKNIRVIGYVQTGTSYIENESGKPAHGYKLHLEHMTKGFFISILSDYSDNTNYRYILGEIGYNF